MYGDIGLKDDRENLVSNPPYLPWGGFPFRIRHHILLHQVFKAPLAASGSKVVAAVEAVVERRRRRGIPGARRA